MDTEADSDALPLGISLDMVAAAIKTSGYPLQLEVADLISDDFSVQHEWSYEDADTLSNRSLDLLASMSLYDLAQHPRIYPAVQLLIECKKTASPYVFFIPNAMRPETEYPLLAGLHSKDIDIRLSQDSGSIKIDLWDIIIPRNHEFITTPPTCFTFSKVVRKGRACELSGSDAFQHIMQPLTKALVHYKSARRPRSTFLYFSIDLPFAVAVIDGPMLTFKEGRLEIAHWVRVYRHEHVSVDDGPSYGRQIAVDVVHKDFMKQYVSDYLKPFANEASITALAHHIEIAEGEGVADDIAAALRGEINPVDLPRDEYRVRLGTPNPHVT